MIEVEIDKEVYLPCYQHLLDENDIDIELIWGGRDSGKSKFVAQYLTEQAMALDYFRCLLIKQTHESIKDAQWQMIQDTATQWGVDHLFSFKTSPLAITCTNGNTFATRGMDKPSKLRSFSNPSHAWIEEGNQISEDAFVTILTSLRSDYGKVKLYITFNPEADTADFNEFWIYRIFFSKYEPNMSFTGKWVIPVTINGVTKEQVLKYRCTHTTHLNNPYVSLQRLAFHESLDTFNPYYYRVYTLGLWGNRENDSPWAFAFDRAKHIGRCEWDPTKYTYLSFDFNTNPICCIVFQCYGDVIYAVQAIRLEDSNIYKLCAVIRATYPNASFLITGDASGKNKSALVKDKIDYYTEIRKELNVSERAIKVPSKNPSLEDNQVLVNSLLQHKRWVIDSVNCKPLIFDLENVRMLPDGSIEKGSRTDEAKRADQLDCFVAETLVITEHGEKRIESIKRGDKVLTRKGLKKVVDTWASIAEVYEFSFEDGTKIQCTKDHKFLNQSSEFTEIFGIFNDNNSVWKIRSNTTALSIPSTPSSRIFIVLNLIYVLAICTLAVYIDKCGLIASVKYPKGIMCITKMATLTIIKSLILNLKRQVATLATISVNALNKIPYATCLFSKPVSKKLQNGIVRPKALNGIGKMPLTTILGNKLMVQRIARAADKASKLRLHFLDSVLINASQHGGEITNLTKKYVFVPDVERNSRHSSISPKNTVQNLVNLFQTHTGVKVRSAKAIGKRLVYDITVESEHEFYANGILVHNCLRYYCNVFHHDFLKNPLPKGPVDITAKVITPEQRIVAAIQAGQQVSCTREEWERSVKDVMAGQIEMWITQGNTEMAGRYLKEMTRLAGLFSA